MTRQRGWARIIDCAGKYPSGQRLDHECLHIPDDSNAAFL